MFSSIHQNKPLQLGLGLGMGLCFGFLLQKGQVTQYDVIIRQLLFKDFTVLKVMLSAVITGMFGVHVLVKWGYARPHIKTGSLGSIVPGGLIFGAGFAILGYCPGTLIGAVGQGSLDALLGGLVGMLLGSSLYAMLYPMLQDAILKAGNLKHDTLPTLLKMNPWVMMVVLAIIFIELFGILDAKGV
jgi:hypothetical protein